MSKMMITNVRNSGGDKLVIVDDGWGSNHINEKNLNWYNENGNVLLTGDLVNDNPVFIVDKDFKGSVKDEDFLWDIQTFDIVKSNIETKKVVNIVDLEHQLSQYKYEFGTTIPKDKLKQIIHDIQYKEVIK